MVRHNYIRRLSIHGNKDGRKTFHSNTRYDWYLLERVPSGERETMVRDERGHEVIEKMGITWEWFPNYAYSNLRKWMVVVPDQTCRIMYSRNAYGSDKKHMSKEKDEVFRYACVHTTTKNGVRFMYSNVNDRGMFGVPKVVFGRTGYQNGIIDWHGQYGLTEHAIAIPFHHLQEAAEILAFTKSSRFKEMMDACSWSNFMIDWYVFQSFRSDFYRH